LSTYCFDLDGTLCSNTYGDYESAQPFVDAITAANELIEAGHRLIVFTARGSGSGLDWRAVTERQLSQWGLKDHELIFGKPEADLYIDDRAIVAELWHEQGNELLNHGP